MAWVATRPASERVAVRGLRRVAAAWDPETPEAWQRAGRDPGAHPADQPGPGVPAETACGAPAEVQVRPNFFTI